MPEKLSYEPTPEDDIDLTWEEPVTRKPEGLNVSPTLAEKLKNPIIQRILNIMLTAAVLTGAGAVALESYKSGQANIEAAQKEIEESNSEKLRADLISRLINEGVSEEDINMVLEDKELMQLYHDMRLENPESFDEYLAKRGIELND